MQQTMLLLPAPEKKVVEDLSVEYNYVDTQDPMFKVNRRKFDLKRDLLIVPKDLNVESLPDSVRREFKHLESQDRVIILPFLKKPAIVST